MSLLTQFMIMDNESQVINKKNSYSYGIKDIKIESHLSWMTDDELINNYRIHDNPLVRALINRIEEYQRKLRQKRDEIDDLKCEIDDTDNDMTWVKDDFVTAITLASEKGVDFTSLKYSWPREIIDELEYKDVL